MAQVSDAHLILDAVQFATEADVAALGQISAKHPNALKPELILRIILTFLPEKTEPESYVRLVRDLVTQSVNALDHDRVLPHPSAPLSNDQAERRVRKLHLTPLPTLDSIAGDDDLLPRFLYSQAHRIDVETGSLFLLRTLLDPFIDHSQFLRIWTTSTIYPLLCLEYDIDLDDRPNYTLANFEALHGPLGLDELLAQTIGGGKEKAQNLGWYMREILAPWIRGQMVRSKEEASPIQSDDAGSEDKRPQKESLWSYLNQQILGLAKEDFSASLDVFVQWDGPGNIGSEENNEQDMSSNQVAAEYSQTCLAAVYVNNSADMSTRTGVRRLLDRASELSDLPPLPSPGSNEISDQSVTLPAEFLRSLSKIHVLQAELLDIGNPLTRPSQESVELAFQLFTSIETLDALGHNISMSSALFLGPLGSEGDQRSMLVKVLSSLSDGKGLDDARWVAVRRDLHWLRTWNVRNLSNGACPAILGRLGSEELETRMLRALLASNRFSLAFSWYCQSVESPLSSANVEKTVAETALKFYDNATNGNRTRGGMKKSSDLITTFHSHFPGSGAMQQIIALLRATHSLSFYSLTLQRGVPLQPANIRAHQDPLQIIDKVLQQNARSYTHLDDLLEIGRNLVRAGLIKDKTPTSREGNMDLLLAKVEQAVIASTIRAALAKDDFDTTYSYIVNRLAGLNRAAQGRKTDTTDDVLWQAAFEAGRYRPKGGAVSSLRRLEQKMELLSQALMLAPSSSVPEVLRAWHEAESEVDTASAQEVANDTSWTKRPAKAPPGAFIEEATNSSSQSRAPARAANDEAPMGLFDVARGAASALHKSAFPLHAQRNAIKEGTRDGEEVMSPTEGRIRKRDVVSNMVTGGLASGIGWVLGAQPVQDEP